MAKTILRAGKIAAYLIVTIAAIIAIAASAAPAAELHVGPGENHTTIQSAIDAAVDLDHLCAPTPLAW